MTCVPLLILACLELGLRWCGYGFDPAFFLRVRIDGEEYFVPNEQFSYLFFPPSMARSLEPFRISAVKAENSYRIFLFGESAANGDPDPTYGVGRYLEVLLRERFPGTRFQVVCVAMTASDSNMILPIARACADKGGDLWLFYMGNNEMVGPFGAETSYGIRAPGRWVIRAVLAVKRLRTGQLLENVMQWARGGSKSQSWGGMQMFANNRIGYDDPARLRAYRNFKDNLEDILNTARSAGVSVVLSTVAVNLKDCPPFASIHGAPLDASKEAAWQESFQAGVARETNQAYLEAVQFYAKAEGIDPRHAELEFRKARCELALTNRDEAGRDFETARDCDALDFRADTRINGIIRESASHHAADGVYLLDGAGLLSAKSADAVPGLDFFYEHVHLNPEGNYQLALSFAEETRKHLPSGMTVRDTGGWCSPEICDRRLALTVWDRRRVWKPIQTRISSPPFTAQFDHEGTLRRYDTVLARVEKGMSAQTPEEARRVYEEAVAAAPEDYFLHGNFERFLEAGGFLPEAVREAKRCCELVPYLPGGYFYAGKLLIEAGNVSEAEGYFMRALAVRADYAEALDGLGTIRANQRQAAAAADYFKRAIRSRPNWVDPYVNLGFLEQSLGNRDLALASYAQAAALQPEGPSDYFHRAAVAGSRNQGDEATACLRAVVRAKPDFWQARYELGVQLAARGDSEEAERQFAAAAMCRPDFIPARLALASALVSQGKLDKALGEYRALLRFDPANGEALQQIGVIEVQLRHEKSEDAGAGRR